MIKRSCSERSIHTRLIMSNVLKQGKTMDLQELISKGIEKAGSLTSLGVQLGLTQPQISAIKAGRKPLPDKSAAKLSIFLNVRLGDVIAAAKYAYAKTEDDRAIWRPFVEHARAASIVLALTFVTTFATVPEARASQNLRQMDMQFILC